MLTCISRPGSQPIHGASPRNMSDEMRVRNRISPIQMNSGSAVSVHEVEAPHTLVAITRPIGREVNSAMATKPTPASASATQTPAASMTNMETTTTMDAVVGSMAAQPSLGASAVS